MRTAGPAWRPSRCTSPAREPVSAAAKPDVAGTASAAAPDRRALDARNFAVLMAGLALALAPHMLRAPLWLTLLTAALIGWRAAALSLRGLLPSKGLLLAIVAVGMLGVWLQYRAIFGRTPGVMLLVMFAGLKTLETRNQRDAAALVFLTWFLAITNFLYTQSIPTALGMLAAVAASVAALVDLAAPRRAARANLRSALLLVGQAVPAALVLFLLFPRVQGPLWGLPQDAYSAQSGLSDTMAPGSLSQLTLSDAIAFRVDFQGEAPPRRTLYWRGPVLWDFDGRTWRLGTPMLADLPGPRNGRRVEYSVLLEPNNRNWLFALEAPVLLPPRARYFEDGQILMPVPVRARMRYDMVSQVEADPDPQADSRFLGRALRLPPGFNPRARALAEGWRAASAGDVQVLQQAIDYFRRERLQYTTEPRLLGRDSVDEFLFESREGFCEHFSSAFVFLMRAAGVPARVVTGYQGGELNPVDGRFTVRQSDAHAWAEVFLRGRGWTRVDPTVLSAPRRLDEGLARAVAAVDALPLMLRPDMAWLRSLRYNWEALTHQWNLLVLGYNPDRQRELMSWFGMRDADWLELASALLAGLGAFVLALFAWMLRRLARPDPVQSAWARFCRKLGARGVARAPHEGPRDYAERAARALPGAGDPIRRIAALYIALRYGPPGGASAPAQSVLELRRMVKDLTFV
jgi:transglutaminase-like putative cysteine protease